MNSDSAVKCSARAHVREFILFINVGQLIDSGFMSFPYTSSNHHHGYSDILEKVGSGESTWKPKPKKSFYRIYNFGQQIDLGFMSFPPPSSNHIKDIVTF